MRRLVLTLALVYRFVAPLAAIVLPMLLVRSRTAVLLWIGIGFVIYAAWGALGHLLGWLHIRCAWQSLHHVKMDPDHPDRSAPRESEVWGIWLIFTVLGIVMIVVSQTI